MDSREYIRRLTNKRSAPGQSGKDDRDRDRDRPMKRQLVSVNGDDDVDGAPEKVYKFRVLLPNGATVCLTIREPGNNMLVQNLVEKVRYEYFRQYRETESLSKKRKINWNSDEMFFVDAFDKKISKFVNFDSFETRKVHILRLRDGSKEAETYENMWDLTPDTDLLKELPQEYTFETALADLIDNSLQAVWCNDENGRKLISVEIDERRISIFDTGAGMDGSEDNSISKWGKMGASLHRSSRKQAIGGSPPYLVPFFGMFGFGGPIASMHLGRRALVSSKTKDAKKVYMLSLSREALLRSKGSEHTWKTDGGLRDPLQDEVEKSSGQCFTKVEIFQLKMRSLSISQLQCRLKDIYFPYIQCDEFSSKGRTTTPIEFQVNGVDLAEIEGGEVAITNLHSCNGPEFTLQLHFKQAAAACNSGLRALQANARLKCVYFPIVEGKESIENILEKLQNEGCGITETFESFSRVSVRRLGRLLPDARWAWLPFMEPPRQGKGDRAHTLKRCCSRVKCFIDTDAGFNPTPSKTDLSQHHLLTTALKHLGHMQLDKDKDLLVEMYRDGKLLTLSQLKKQYQDWVLQMHDTYDTEIDGGEDEPILIIDPKNKKKLGISADIVRVHKVLNRKGKTWKSEQPIKILKGAHAGCHKNHVYAILECFLLEGFQGDACGEARFICRPKSVPEDNGCLLSVNNNEKASIDIRGSMSLPISVIDAGKCLPIESAEWNLQIERQRLKGPSSIDLLSPEHCQELELEGKLPSNDVVSAGHVPPKEIVAVLRPNSFYSSSDSKNLDQKYIVKESYDMFLEIKFNGDERHMEEQRHIHSARISPSSRRGYQGLYIFELSCKPLKLFQRSGCYTFSFSVRDSNCKSLVKSIHVKASSEIKEWGLLTDERTEQYVVRVGALFPPISIVCYDEYKNQIGFPRVQELMVKITSDKGDLGHLCQMNVHLSADKSILEVKDLLIQSRQLDTIRPSFEAFLSIASRDELFSVDIPFQVIPGLLHRVTCKATVFDKQLTPGQVIEELVLETFDVYGNHMRAGEQVLLEVDGFIFLDKASSIRKVNDQGCIDLSGMLKVKKGYGETVSLSVFADKKIIFKEEFQTEKRELKAASEIPTICDAGSQLENIEFKIVNTEGEVDESIHDDEMCGQSHTLTIKSKSMDTDDSIRYSFRRGHCIVRAIPLPHQQGVFSFMVVHSRHPELYLTIEVNVVQGPSMDPGYMHSQSSDGNMFPLQELPAFVTPKVESETYDDVVLHQQTPDGKMLHSLSSDRNMFPRQELSAFITPKEESETCDDVVLHQQTPDGNMLLLPHLSASVDSQLLENNTTKQKLADEICQYGISVGERDDKLKCLRWEKASIEQDLYMLEVSMKKSNSSTGHIPESETVIANIESRGESAAAVVVRLSKEFQPEEQDNSVKNSVLGVVAILATVQTNELSRILAKYLGEDQMLALVCKSYADAKFLESYDAIGNVNPTEGLHASANELGLSITGPYTVICLEDISPYSGEVETDPQGMLSLSDPVLPNGKKPSGFLGYTVNMIYLDHHLHRTTLGHSLRETLFYRLFGELQVYETREHMIKAYDCIKDGAVSLDGGIYRGNGIVSLGNWEPSVQFPVAEYQLYSRVLEKKMQLREKVEEIEKESQIRQEDLNRLNKKTVEYNLLLQHCPHSDDPFHSPS